MVKKYGPEPEPEDDAADAAATDEEDDEHPRVAPGKNADGADGVVLAVLRRQAVQGAVDRDLVLAVGFPARVAALHAVAATQ